ncbi:PTS sugar transporter subunit IIC [Culicoidibacter larvae]|uniref:Permease IIC component n=1 Tax=Culicoidibacter larvae TaxID=2579976 RepID=A0A5R8QAN8_9FIRM|nr:PTS transporter subunit EIIC [Culicoidibacter larvae]TLG72695.1 PTS sugar transporter subunit IIC [Culicoidibacter larvae]
MQNNFFIKIKQQIAKGGDVVSSNIYILSIRDGFLYATPLIIISSFFLLFINFPLPNWNELMSNILGDNWKVIFSAPVNAITNIIALLAVLSISFKLADRKKSDSFQIAITALVAFLIVTPFFTEIFDDQGSIVDKINSLPLKWIGANGLFLAIIIAIVTTNLYVFLKEKNITIKLSSNIPKEVANSFTALVPCGIIIIVFTICGFLMTLTPFGTLHQLIYSLLQQPLLIVGSSLPMVLVSVLIVHVFWFLGINGTSIVSSVYGPILSVLSIENLEVFQSGGIPSNIVTGQFQGTLVVIGGAGATLSLCLVIIFFCKSKELRELIKLAIVPSIFGINEPILFGLPIVLNPKLLVPFILVPLVNTIISYFAIYFNFVPCTNGIQIPWTTPPIISGFLLHGWSGSVLQVILILIGMLIYFPFIKKIDNQYLIVDNEQAQLSSQDIHANIC